MHMIVPRCALSVQPVPSEAEQALADRLAFEADGNDPDDFRPGWQGDHYEPSPLEEAEERGYVVGLAGGSLHSSEAFPGQVATAVADGRLLAFVRGRRAGLREHARRAGYQLGLAAQKRERPPEVSRGYEADALAGWDAGFDEFCERQRILAGLLQREEVEAADAARERDEDHEARERGGWYRAALALI